MYLYICKHRELHLKLTYRQFLDLTVQEKGDQITQAKMDHKNIA